MLCLYNLNFHNSDLSISHQLFTLCVSQWQSMSVCHGGRV